MENQNLEKRFGSRWILMVWLAGAWLGPLTPPQMVPSAWQAMAEPHTYSIDRAHSMVGFEVRHFFNKVPGRFTRFDGKVTYDAEKPENSSVHLVVEVDSVNTDLATRDQHLRSEDFFFVEQHPQMSFRSTTVKKGEGDTLQVTGDFTLRGKTQRLTIPITVLGVMELGPGVAKAGFETEFVINRKDFDVSWNRSLDQGGAMLGDDVTIRVILQLDRVPDTAGEAAGDETDG